MNKYSWLLALGASLLVVGCQKVINVDLNSASPAIVIVGNINDQPGPYTVTLNQTVNFSDPNSFPPVNGAFITISDNVGNIDTLVQVNPGIYHTQKISGVQGRTYTIKVVSNGQTYTSASTMPQVVPFDTMRAIIRVGIMKKDTNLYPQVGFQDPPTGLHYYRFIETRNDTLTHNVFVIDDQYSSGLYLSFILRSDTALAYGDSVKVEMQCIDEGTYNYLSTFYVASGSAIEVTPANPISSFSNNALGYFSAHTSQYRTVKVPNR